jgi:DNA-binding beta-propeller fold protein YncE
MPVIAPPPRRARKVSNGPIFDIGNMSYDSVFFSAQNETLAAFQVQFSPDGTKMFIMGGTPVGSPEANIWRYDLSPAWDIASASFVSSVNITGNNGFAFKPDGTKMYAVKSGFPEKIEEYNLSPAWDISSASFVHELTIADQGANPSGLAFKSDGTVCYIAGAGDRAVYQYDLSTAWDVTTMSVNGSLYVGANDAAMFGLAVEQNGTKVFVSGLLSNAMFQYSLSIAHDVTSGTYDNESFDFTPWEGTPKGIFFKPDATKMYMVGQDNDTVFQYSLN